MVQGEPRMTGAYQGQGGVGPACRWFRAWGGPFMEIVVLMRYAFWKRGPVWLENLEPEHLRGFRDSITEKPSK